MVSNRKSFCATLSNAQSEAEQAYVRNIGKGRTDEANRILEYLAFSGEIYGDRCKKRKRRK